MYRHLPNQLTMLRLLLAGMFFLALSQYRYGEGPGWVLGVSIGLFVLAALTDAADGYLARLWHVESTFGRIMDPFCDKVLIIGAFLYLSGPRFVDAGVAPHGQFPFNIVPGNVITGVYPWMVALILARELLVTGIRGELEGRGIAFGANIWGKLKMVLQCVTVPVVLLIVWIDPNTGDQQWLKHVIAGLVYVTVAVTVISGLPYITAASRAMKSQSKPR